LADPARRQVGDDQELAVLLFTPLVIVDDRPALNDGEPLGGPLIGSV
jgi:hypothetical protein